MKTNWKNIFNGCFKGGMTIKVVGNGWPEFKGGFMIVGKGLTANTSFQSWECSICKQIGKQAYHSWG